MGDTRSADKPLTDRLLRSWTRCRRRAWLDRHGDDQLRLYTAHRTLQLDDQQRSFVALMAKKPGHGLQACEQGEGGVVGLRLRSTTRDGFAVEAHPALLQTSDSSSYYTNSPFSTVADRAVSKYQCVGCFGEEK